MREKQGGAPQVLGGANRPPFCPLLCQFLPTGASPIMLPGGGSANQINMELLRVPCMLTKDCMFWDEEWGCCGFRSMMEMVADLYSEGAVDGEQIQGDPPDGSLPDGNSAGDSPAPGAAQPPAGG
jgi:hypothetical protein